MLYHCTNASSAKSICEEGLKTTYSIEHEMAVVFLLNTPRHDFGCVCFKVDMDKNNIKETVNYGEYISANDIPKENIKFYSYLADE